ncbi:GGDEF domain-containing protein [Helicobacter sp. MIT 14-3879]|uniref:GGDEF domain-containing protein n=1 Tax=Helicobacter sp. MIT 14-3879 TaxID=2040649 RepID=UPI000E1E7FE1|nr:GGDEF domain-containing protein [Helicobacter sp. MIT 14-3879]RDU64811.1 hypothetical protein CQA44_03630 [Helicobacter sp. MIT 14-3879]
MKISKNNYFIYIIIIVLFSLLYALVFITNRIQYINSDLELQRNEISHSINNVVNLNQIMDIRQIKYFINHIKLLEILYKNNSKLINNILKNNIIYDFIGIVSPNGEYKYANNFDFKQLANFDNKNRNTISSNIIYDESSNKSYKVFSYPLFVGDKLEGYIIAYLDINFLLNMDNLYLASEDSHILSNAYVNDIYIGHKNLSFIYPEAWKNIDKGKEGQFICDSIIFTFKEISFLKNINNFKINSSKLYLVSIIKMNPKDNPYHIHDIKSFIKYADFKKQILYWIIGYIWILFASILFFIIIVNKIKADNLSNFDPMTGVYNRRKGFLLLNKVIEKYSFSSKSLFNNVISKILYFKTSINSIHICLVDVDNLKQVNDKLGHKYGDELIINVVDIINKHLKYLEFIIRIGGDEFLVVFINRKIIDIEEIWKDISKDFEEKNNSGTLRYNIRASKGVFEYRLGMDIESCIVEADKLMYQEKRAHKINLFFN